MKNKILCRDCFSFSNELNSKTEKICPFCGSIKTVSHSELNYLSIAHIDCDSFYASIEKRDRPELMNKPIVVGGKERGVVAAACYVSRKYGIRSAMPTFKAKKLCPELIIISPRMSYYQKVSKQIRKLMLTLTPIVQPVSIDEAFMDLSGTEKLHKSPPAESLVKLQRRIHNELMITVSVGLSYNKSMAKLASEQEKPNGFYIIGKNEARNWLSLKPVSIIYGIGKTTVQKLNKAGVETCKDLQKKSNNKIKPILGQNYQNIINLSLGIDERKVIANNPSKSLSVETTLTTDSNNKKELSNHLHALCEKLSDRLKKSGLYANTIILKLKLYNHKIKTRNMTLEEPFQLAHILFKVSEKILNKELESGEKYRLIGVGVSSLKNDKVNKEKFNFMDQEDLRKTKLEKAFDDIKNKMGPKALVLGRHINTD